MDQWQISQVISALRQLSQGMEQQGGYSQFCTIINKAIDLLVSLRFEVISLSRELARIEALREAEVEPPNNE